MNTPNPADLDKVLEKINEIAKESATGNYIYRGEPKHHDIISSSLYREYCDIEAEHFDIAVVQEDILREAREYTPHKMDNFELIATLQHHGDKTNLIDFTTDYLVALFFACDGEPEEPGRVILLQKQSETYKVEKPPKTIRRAETQKSIFVQAPKGFVKPNKVVSVPAHLKSALLDHLRKHHDISTKTIYNDLQGFIENRGLHKSAYTEFYKGLTCQERANSAKTQAKKQKWYDAAITHYTETVGLNPEFADVYNNRGVAYLAKSEVDRAIRDFNIAIELSPEESAFYNNRGITYGRKGNFDRSIQEHNKAIELDTENADAYYNRGVAYAEKGKVAAAIQDYNKAIDINSEYVEAYVNRGVAYAGKADFDQAIQDYNKAIDINSEYVEAYVNRGVAYAGKADFNREIQDYNTAIDLNPELADVYYNRGFTYFVESKIAAAIQDFNTAIDLNPKDSDAYTARCIAWLSLKDWQKAKDDLTAAKIVVLFHNGYESVEEFEAKHGVTLPADIAALLQESNISQHRES